MPEERIVFNDPEEARAWDMYACANIGCGGWGMMFECADMMLLERRKRMAPEKVEREWIAHKPGDPMPCGGETLVNVRFWGGLQYSFPCEAYKYSWGDEQSQDSKIIAWRPA